MTKFDQKEIDDIKRTLTDDPNSLTEDNRTVILNVLAMVDELYNPKISQNKAPETLRKMMGILPKSERGSSDKFDIELKPKETDPAKIKLESDIHNLLNKHKRLYGKKARHNQAKNYRKSRVSPRHGGEEALYNKSKLIISDKDFMMKIDRKAFFSNINGLRSSTEAVKRFDLNISISENSYKVETITDPRTGQTVRASMADVGPKGWNVTWNAMVNIVQLVVVFSMPAHRAAAFLGNNKGAFSESTIQRILQFVARAAAPIYGQTCLQMANSLRIQGDDTSTRVLEVERRVRDAEGESILDDDTMKKFQKHLAGDEQFQIKNRKIELNGTEDSINVTVEKIDNLLGFEFKTVNGEFKKKLNLSMATGRIVHDDQFSQISIVRTHLGSFGNLLGSLGRLRDPKNSQIFVQSDLSSSNHAPQNIYFIYIYAGCMAHARRPFWRFREDDPLITYFFLRGFALLSVVEDIIDIHERTEEQTLYWRKKYALKIWNILKRRAEIMIRQHMPSSDLHKAANYIINNFGELTRYLYDSWLHPTNNQLERTLRTERTMLNNSKFRQSRTGRQSYDILRTIQLCCVGANVSFVDYLNWMLINNEKVAINPEQWTPYAYRLKLIAAEKK